MAAGFCVYVLASRKLGTLYVDYTSDLVRRIYEHREDAVPDFTKTYGVKRLVYYEEYDDPRVAQQRKRSLKRWPRGWKTNLIKRDNPNWDDLYENLMG